MLKCPSLIRCTNSHIDYPCSYGYLYGYNYSRTCPADQPVTYQDMHCQYG
ncbi:hypothetical protein BACCOPRO_01456 [Phocaeicola coprophilus DSM 18228 = JCM 13818]|uniref:Uncharacterized protein n=1 Tax=Phocaeicola coprophilus DSM 18228 = JCM 13818 TaxID=547042 RepID=S0F869_9BACT|nr:hypothetical protein BACCOPRO_01456 [Phocaeicola coprophilus DSM 18228 = JCM 13818]